MISEEVTKRIITTAEDWPKERDSVLSYDHPGVDWLFVQIEHCETAEFGVRYETYRVADLVKGDWKPQYDGEEFPEAIATMF